MLYPTVVEVARGGAPRRLRPRPSQRRVALVAGSAGGPGRAIARRLAHDGLAVAVNDGGDPALAVEVAGAIREEGGVAEAFSADATDERQAADLVAAVAERLGPVDVLVLNVAGPRPEAPLALVAWEGHVAQLERFVKGPVVLGRALLPGMAARRSGRIVQVDCDPVDGPPPGRSAYATAKSAQIGLTRSWARELAPLGITVNAIAPGRPAVEPHTREEIAHAVSFIASEAAGFITGQRIVVDGGRGPAA
jgi:3-oxoacyl-[acyl-carrier protein] reductase